METDLTGAYRDNRASNFPSPLPQLPPVQKIPGREIILDRDSETGAPSTGSGPAATRFLAYFEFEPRPDRTKNPQAPLTIAEHLRAAIPGVRWDKTMKAHAIPAIAANLKRLESFAELHGFTLPPDFATFATQLRAEALATIESSRALAAEFETADLGGTLLPYQRAGAAFLAHHRRALETDEMGLGKTVQALAALWYLKAFPAVVVCPASLKYNWENEARLWLPGISTEVVEGSTLRGGARLTIVNYDILDKHVEGLRANGCEAVVCDEAHYLKNARTKRFTAVKALIRGVANRFLLTGTPMENRPVEVLPLLQLIGRVDDVGGFWHVAKEYCAGEQRVFKKSDGKKRWDLTGSGNVREFGLRLRATCMIRRRKSDVLRELPPKRRVYLPLPLSNQPEYDFAQRQCLEWVKEQALKDPKIYAPLVGLPADEQLAALARIAHEAGQKFKDAEALVKVTVLQGLAVAGKLPAAIDWIRNFLDTGENLVLFANRRTILERVGAEFGVEPLTGDTPSRRRAEMVAQYQAGIDAKTLQPIPCNVGRLFLANLKAGGVGLTLTAASNVAFLEEAWNPALIDQAEDRCHRYGQQSAVTCWHLLGRNSIDYHIRDVARGKRSTAEELLA